MGEEGGSLPLLAQGRSTTRKALLRQVEEAVRIEWDIEVEMMNSKKCYGTKVMTGDDVRVGTV